MKIGKGAFASYANAMLAEKDARLHPVTMRALDLAGPTPVSATMESGGRVVRIAFDEPIQGTADAAGMLLNGTKEVVTAAVAATKQGGGETRELLLSLRQPVLKGATLTVLEGAVKDREGNPSAGTAFTLSPDIDPSLKELYFGNGTLSPAFSPAVAEYTLTLPAGTKETTLKATAIHDGTKLAIGSEPAISGLAKTVAIPEDGILTVRSAIGGGIATMRYTVQVKYASGDDPGQGSGPITGESPKPEGSLDVGHTAKVTSETNEDGRVVVTANIAAEAVAAALRDGRKGQLLYLETKEQGDEIVVRVPAGSMRLMKEAGASLLVRSPLLTVTVDASAALADSVPSDEAAFALIVESAPVDWQSMADEVAQGQSHGIERLTSPVRVKAEWVTGGKAAAVPQEALKGQFGKSTAGVYRFDETLGVWIYVAAAAAGSSFHIESNDYYAALKPILNRFKDTAGHWAKPDIEWMARRLLANGTSGTTFSADASVTRAEFTALMARALQLPASGGDGNEGYGFDDVAATAWYRKDVFRAVAAGIVNGRDTRRFAPDATITRQEMAVMIGRAYSYLGLAASPSGPDPAETFADGGQIGDWAKDAVALAVGEGLLKGVTEDRFDPSGLTTRAQAAVVLKRLLVKLEK